MTMCIELPAGVFNRCKATEAKYLAEQARLDDIYCGLWVIFFIVLCFLAIMLMRSLLTWLTKREVRRNIRKDLVEQTPALTDRSYVACVEINTFKRKYFKYSANHVDQTAERIYYYFIETGLPLSNITYSITVGATK